MEQIERITQMEQCLDQLTEATRGLSDALNRYVEAQTAAQALGAYLSSGEWQKDYEADEAGLLPLTTAQISAKSLCSRLRLNIPVKCI